LCSLDFLPQDPHCVGRDYKSQMTCNAILGEGTEKLLGC